MKLMVAQLLSKFPAFLVTERTRFSDKHNPYYDTIYFTFTLIIFSDLELDISNDLVFNDRGSSFSSDSRKVCQPIYYRNSMHHTIDLCTPGRAGLSCTAIIISVRWIRP
jgi:hypothetical protein